MRSNDVFRLARLLPEIVERGECTFERAAILLSEETGSDPRVLTEAAGLRGDPEALLASISLLDRAAELAARPCRR